MGGTGGGRPAAAQSRGDLRAEHEAESLKILLLVSGLPGGARGDGGVVQEAGGQMMQCARGLLDVDASVLGAQAGDLLLDHGLDPAAQPPHNRVHAAAGPHPPEARDLLVDQLSGGIDLGGLDIGYRALHGGQVDERNTGQGADGQFDIATQSEIEHDQGAPDVGGPGAPMPAHGR